MDIFEDKNIDIDKILQIKIPRWDELPDFGIYNDQLIAIVENSVGEYFPENTEDKKIITSSMINNYVKWKMMPKPIKKKYNKIQIAHCIVITMLKPILNIAQITKGIELQVSNTGYEKGYNTFCDKVEESINNVFAPLKEEKQMYVNTGIKCEMKNLGLTTICNGLCFKLMAQIIIDNDGIVQKKDDIIQKKDE